MNDERGIVDADDILVRAFDENISNIEIKRNDLYYFYFWE
jgi:hypothetical protein